MWEFSAGPLVACCLGVLPLEPQLSSLARFLLTAELAVASEPAGILLGRLWKPRRAQRSGRLSRAPGDFTQSGSTQRPSASNVLQCSQRALALLQGPDCPAAAP